MTEEQTEFEDRADWLEAKNPRLSYDDHYLFNEAVEGYIDKGLTEIESRVSAYDDYFTEG